MKKIGAYVHIPFCKQKCYYCDFLSFANKAKYEAKYIECLIKEIRNFKQKNKNIEFDTIYIGGGTPSYIDVENIKKILKELTKNNELNKIKEITMEVNPGTLFSYNELNSSECATETMCLNDRVSEKKYFLSEGKINNVEHSRYYLEEKMIEYKKMGINRLSIGLQSTNNQLLRSIGRIHTFEDFLETYKIAEKIGFSNINVDLMIGLPNQTFNDIKNELERIIKLEPKHISVYSLILEENTKLEQMVKNKQVTLPDEELERHMYWYAKNILELNGYEHYEISNFAKAGFESKHNKACWEQEEYIGFGLGAHSYIDNVRFSNIEDLRKYIDNLSTNNFEKNIIIHEVQDIQMKEKEYMLLSLRKIDGVNLQNFENKFHVNPIYIFRNELQKLSNYGLIKVNGDRIMLTNKGIDFANIVWEEFV